MKASEAADGAVSVIVRVRPPLQAEAPYELCTRVDGRKVFFNASAPQGRGPRPHSGQQRGKMIECELDRVLDMNGSQEDVWRAVCPKVEKVLEGYNATIFTYGMTGSGKTFTMLGPTLMSVAWQERGPSFQEVRQCRNKGLVPRAVELLFDKLGEQGGDAIEVKMSYLHVYRERCYDLLQPAASSQPLRVREEGASRQGNSVSSVYVEGLTEAPVSSVEECLAKLLYGSSNIAFRSTAYNEQSSRSHVLLTLTLTQTLSSSGLVRHSKLHLVDLAGNERWDTFGPDMSQAHAREMTSINQSLHVLGNCIQVLSQPPGVSKRDGRPVQAHVPYRNSTLTMLLRESLSGNSFTVMLCTICGCSLYQVQSLCTLRFADRAKRVKMRAKVNESVDSEVLLKQSQAEVVYLRSLMAEGGASEELQQRIDQLEGENKDLKEQLQRVTAEKWTARPSMIQGGGMQIASGAARVSSQGENRPLLLRLRRSNSEPALLAVDPWFGAESSADVGRHCSAGILNRKRVAAASSTSLAPFRRRPDQFARTQSSDQLTAVPLSEKEASTRELLPLPLLPATQASASTRRTCNGSHQLARRLEGENQDLRCRISELMGLPEPAAPKEAARSDSKEVAASQGGEEGEVRRSVWTHAAAMCPRGHALECLGNHEMPIGTARYHDWRCDAGCGGGSKATPERERFHCQQCQYDLCDRCIRTAVEGLANPHSDGRLSPKRSTACQGRSSGATPSGRGGLSANGVHSQPPRPRPTPRDGGHQAIAAGAEYAMPAAPSGPAPARQRRPSRPGRSLSERRKLPQPTDYERNRHRTLMEYYRQKVTAPAEAAAQMGSPREKKPLTTVAVGSRALRQEPTPSKSTQRAKPMRGAAEGRQAPASWSARNRQEPSVSPGRQQPARAPSLRAHSSKESLGVMVAPPEYRSRSEGPMRSGASTASTAPSSPGGSPRAADHRGAAAMMVAFSRPSMNSELKLPAISASAACEAAAAEAAISGRQHHSPVRRKEPRPILGAPLSPLGTNTAPRAPPGRASADVGSSGSSAVLLHRAKEVQSAAASAAATPGTAKQLPALHARIGIDGLLPPLERKGEAGQKAPEATEVASSVADAEGTEKVAPPASPPALVEPPPPPLPVGPNHAKRRPPPPMCFAGAGKASSIGALLGEIDARRELENLGLKQVTVQCS